MRTDLNGRWMLYYYPERSRVAEKPSELAGVPSIPAAVPGNVELDLAKAGLLPEDLYRGMNILSVQAFENHTFWYRRAFTPASPANGERVYLHFDGVDCLATYYLNDQEFASSDDMYIEQVFDVTDLIRFGEENDLAVRLSSPVLATAAEKRDPLTLALGRSGLSVSQSVRKAPHSYGWDIMPRALSAGLWRDVFLEYRPALRLDYAYFSVTSLLADTARCEMIYSAELGEETFKSHPVILEGRCGDYSFRVEEKALSSAGRVRFEIDKAFLWWPKHYGEPRLFDLELTIFSTDGEPMIREKFRQGFRELRLVRSDVVEPGGQFAFYVNGVKIMAIGSNWVPLDAFHSRDKERLSRALALAEEAGCNILRCWGGNVYESDAFFDFCDEKGILVWQDFAMACCFYPQTEAFFGKMRREAEALARRLRNHASLALWCGDNEVDSFLAPAGRIKPSVNRLTRDVLPAVLDRMDPYRPYIPSSPYVSDRALAAGRAAWPEDHLWGPRDYFKSPFYLGSNAYFISEIGYHGCPSLDSIKKFIDPDKVWPPLQNEQWTLHSTDQKNDPRRVELMFKQIHSLFGKDPEDPEGFIAASQISQAEAKKFFIERVRAKGNVMGGVIWWNLLDGWPQMSDAVVDYYFEKKLAFSYIKRSSRPVLVFLGEREGEGHPVLLSDLTREEATVTVRVTDAATGKTVFSGGGSAAANEVRQIGFIPVEKERQGMFLIEYDPGGERLFNTYLYGTPAFSLSDYLTWKKAAEERETSCDS